MSKFESGTQRFREKQRNLIEVVGTKEGGKVVVFRYPGEPDQELPVEQFEEQYEPVFPELGETFGFGRAIELAKKGKLVARSGWNGKGMYVSYCKGKDHEHAIIEPFFVILNVRNAFNTWVPSISDVLAEDWRIVE